MLPHFHPTTHAKEILWDVYTTHICYLWFNNSFRGCFGGIFYSFIFKNAESKWCQCMTDFVRDTEGKHEIVNVIMFYFISISLHYRMPFKFNSPFNWPYPSLYISDWRSCLLSMYIFLIDKKNNSVIFCWRESQILLYIFNL